MHILMMALVLLGCALLTSGLYGGWLGIRAYRLGVPLACLDRYIAYHHPVWQWVYRSRGYRFTLDD